MVNGVGVKDGVGVRVDGKTQNSTSSSTNGSFAYCLPQFAELTFVKRSSARRWAAASGYASIDKSKRMELYEEKHLKLDNKDCKEHYDANRFPDVQFVTKPPVLV